MGAPEKFNVGFSEAGVGLVHHFSGGVYAKETRIPAGLKLTQHRHPFEHMSVLVSGSVEVVAEGVRKYLSGFSVLNMPAGVAHEVSALTDTVWLCIHATEETDPEKVDHEILR